MATQQTTAVTITPTQKKALTLREELFSRKDQFAAAMPSWMTVDRLLRVVFTTSLSNPKILDCSKESIFGAIMQCAQVGLEPILGRAYLIPYNNNKYIDGKWVKTLECQFQPGYQGLVDLARRSNTISDIQARNVFENDEFDIDYEKVPPFHHKPWFITNKRESGPGELLGAYANWILKDGTRHFDFMYIADIYKRRDVSQAYKYAIENPNNKKAQECPWIQWEEEQTVKTVIKHSSKVVPASIEYMQAVQFDNLAEVGGIPRMNPMLNGSDAGSYFLMPGDDDAGAAGTQDDVSLQERFDLLINDRKVNVIRVKEFVDYAARYYKVDIVDVLGNALGNADNFIKEFLTWEQQKYPAKQVLTGGAAGETPRIPTTVADEIGRLKNAGLIEWEKTNHDDIPHMAPGDKKIFAEKWRRVIGKGYTEEGQPGFKGAPSSAGEERQPPHTTPTAIDQPSQGADGPPSSLAPNEDDEPPWPMDGGSGEQGNSNNGSNNAPPPKISPPPLPTPKQVFLLGDDEKVTPIPPWTRTNIFNDYKAALGGHTVNELIEKHNITDLYRDSDLIVTKFFEDCKALMPSEQ